MESAPSLETTFVRQSISRTIRASEIREQFKLIDSWTFCYQKPLPKTCQKRSQESLNKSSHSLLSRHHSLFLRFPRVLCSPSPLSESLEKAIHNTARFSGPGCFQRHWHELTSPSGFLCCFFVQFLILTCILSKKKSRP